MTSDYKSDAFEHISVASSHSLNPTPNASQRNLAKKPTVAERLLPSEQSSPTFNEQSQRIWRPTTIHYRPLLGILALAVSVASMLAALAILVVSNGQPTDSEMWKVQPTV